MTLNDTELAFIAALDAAVDAKGEDYTYSDPGGPVLTCVYVRRGQPSCLIGQAMFALDPLETKTLEHSASNTGTANSVLPALFPGIKHIGIISAAQEAQDIQDGGGRWGHAREVFHQALRKYQLEPVS